MEHGKRISSNEIDRTRDRPRKTSEQPCRTFSFDKTLKGIPLGAPCFSLGKAELARLASKNIISRRVEEREREGKEEGRGGREKEENAIRGLDAFCASLTHEERKEREREKEENSEISNDME